MLRLMSLGAVVLLMAVMIVSTADAGPKAATRDESLRMGETRSTMDPAQFSDPRVRMAYQVAKDIPWVLDSLYCFCLCKESPTFRHKSLLSCYVDNHAAV